MASTKEFTRRRRVTLEGLPVVEFRKITDDMPPYGVIRFTLMQWQDGASGGQWLCAEGTRVPVELRLSSDHRELEVRLLLEKHEDLLFRQQVRSGTWVVELGEVPTDFNDADAAELSRLDTQESALARDLALADYEEERAKQERRERKRVKETSKQ